jgi:putative transposase
MRTTDKRISQRKATVNRRETMTCRVYEAKIDKSHLSKTSLKHLNSLFIEAKWFYNYCLSQDDVDNSNTTLKSVLVKVIDNFEERKFNSLSSQMKQGIKTRLFGSLMSLKSRKTKGYKVGRLKFKSQINSIPLKQNNKTYYLDFNKSRIKIQSMKQWLRVKGLSQIPLDSEIANATLVRKVNDYYIHITTFSTKEVKVIPEASVGIDFGCNSQLTLSNGIKISYQVPVSTRIKRLDRKIMKGNRHKKAKTKNLIKDLDKRAKAYSKLNNKKKDIRNKVVNAITTNYKYIAFQDESISNWKQLGHGKKIQFSGIGGIIEDLKNKSHTPIVVDKWFPSTQLCPSCNKKNIISLEERNYICSCGYTNDRDIKSAIMIKREGLKNNNLVPMEYRDIKPVETLTSVFHNTLNNIHGIVVSKLEPVKQEAPLL